MRLVTISAFEYVSVYAHVTSHLRIKPFCKLTVLHRQMFYQFAYDFVLCSYLVYPPTTVLLTSGNFLISQIWLHLEGGPLSRNIE